MEKQLYGPLDAFLHEQRVGSESLTLAADFDEVMQAEICSLCQLANGNTTGEPLFQQTEHGSSRLRSNATACGLIVQVAFGDELRNGSDRQLKLGV